LDPILQGLNLSILGLFFTFSALGIFILIMVILKRVYPFKPEAEGNEEGEGAGEEGSQPGVEAVTISAAGCEDEEIAAAIAVAIQYFRSRREESLGANLLSGRGRWWATNRLAARQGPQNKV
jgi:sodium pump decarboxylase gamma subunit